MSTMESGTIACGGCQRQFAWKPQLAGKRVKCRCGETITVAGKPGGPAAMAVASRSPAVPTPKPKPKPKPAPPADDLGDLYALADDADRAAAAMPAEVRDVPEEDAAPPVKRAGGKGSPLAYQRGTTIKERQQAAKHAAALVDPTRDVSVPIALLVCGFGLYIADYGYQFHLDGGGLAAAGVGLSILLAVKVAVLVGFALVASGPLGVGFGSVGTAILKLAGIAVFTDGVTAWLDTAVTHASGGTFGNPFGYGFIVWPAALGIYWGLMIYLFGFDPGESWMVVVCLTVVDRIGKALLMMLLLTTVLSWGGRTSAAPMIAPSVMAPPSASTSALATRVDELTQAHQLKEARKYIADGHQGVLEQPVADWYAAGCRNVWFEMSGADINGRRSAQGLIVELPKEKGEREKCRDILAAYYKDIGSPVEPADLKDDGDDYMAVGLR